MVVLVERQGLEGAGSRRLLQWLGFPDTYHRFFLFLVAWAVANSGGCSVVFMPGAVAVRRGPSNV